MWEWYEIYSTQQKAWKLESLVLVLKIHFLIWLDGKWIMQVVEKNVTLLCRNLQSILSAQEYKLVID